MFGIMLLKSLRYQLKQMLIIIFSVIISSALSTAILNIMYCEENHLFNNLENKTVPYSMLLQILKIITIIALIATIILIYAVSSVCIYQRTTEFAVLKANGAYSFELQLFFLTQLTVASIVGQIAGYFTGSALTQYLSASYFNFQLINTITIIPIVVTIMLAVTLAGALPSLYWIKKLDPTTVF